jgi:adenine-specific DNA-methyltransferase
MDPARPEKITVGKPLLDRDVAGKLVPPAWERVGKLVPIWPVDEEGGERVWCYESKRMATEIKNGNIKVGRFNPKRNTYAVNVRRVRRTKMRFRERTIWWEKAYDSGSNGTNVLKKLLGASGLFDFPKSVYAVRDVLACVLADRPDAVVLDYFAGSGTTLHATSLLNIVDGGSRRCILVTNNEVNPDLASKLHDDGHFRGDPEYEAMGICRRVTVPRVVAALSGERPDGTPVPGRYKWAGKRPLADGFPENAAFFDLVYENPDQIEIGARFADVAPTLWLTAGAVGDPTTLVATKRWLLPADRPLAVLLDEDAFNEFASAVESRVDLTHVWLVTDSEAAFSRMRSKLPSELDVGMLYRDYLRSFRINVEP